MHVAVLRVICVWHLQNITCQSYGRVCPTWLCPTHTSPEIRPFWQGRETHTEKDTAALSGQAVLIIPTEPCGEADICSFCTLMVEVGADLLIQVTVTIASNTVAVKCADF